MVSSKHFVPPLIASGALAFGMMVPSFASANPIPEGQMQRYCSGEASSQLGVRPNYIEVDAYDRVSGYYLLDGRTTDGSGRTFICRFDRERNFVGVSVQGGGSASQLPSGGGASDSTMERYCRGEAAGELGVRPNYVETDAPERSRYNIIVRGRTTRGGPDATFRCTFDRDGNFQNIDVQRGGSASQLPSNSASDSTMERYCRGEAAGELGVRPNYVETDRPERTRYNIIVRGRSTGGGPESTFRCTFDQDGNFRNIDVQRGSSGGSSTGGSSAGGVPSAATRRCLSRFGEDGEITTVSPLRPGFWELIIDATRGSRSAACTVREDGTIRNWIELN